MHRLPAVLHHWSPLRATWSTAAALFRASALVLAASNRAWEDRTARQVDSVEPVNLSEGVQTAESHAAGGILWLQPQL